MMIPKSRPVRSRALRYSARGAPCAVRVPGHCNHDPETTVLAHAPGADRGMARKASDIHAAHACSGCHDVLDGRAPTDLPDEVLLRCWIEGIAETQQRWVADGLIQAKGDN